MNSYLLLQDGSLFEGKIIGQSKNVLGEILLDEQGAVKVYCKQYNKSNDTEGEIVLSDMDFKNLKLKIGKSKAVQGKIVTDTLPVEYHVYDLKTYVPLNLK